jgi:hypothetical protein
MRNYRVWIEILFLGTAIAFALALLIATLGAAAAGDTAGKVAQEDSHPTTQQSYDGMVTCSRCGARHSGALGHTAADCARNCIRGGASFVLVEPDATYMLDGDLGVLGGLAGRRARVVGELNGRTIRISSAALER